MAHFLTPTVCFALQILRHLNLTPTKVSIIMSFFTDVKSKTHTSNMANKVAELKIKSPIPYVFVQWMLTVKSIPYSLMDIHTHLSINYTHTLQNAHLYFDGMISKLGDPLLIGKSMLPPSLF